MLTSRLTRSNKRLTRLRNASRERCSTAETTPHRGFVRRLRRPRRHLMKKITGRPPGERPKRDEPASDDLRTLFGEEPAGGRLKARLTQAQMAERTGLTQQYVSRRSRPPEYHCRA